MLKGVRENVLSDIFGQYSFQGNILISIYALVMKLCYTQSFMMSDGLRVHFYVRIVAVVGGAIFYL